MQTDLPQVTNGSSHAPAKAGAHSGLNGASPDPDPQETQDWIESLEAVVAAAGGERARFLVQRVLESSFRLGVAPELPLNTEYINTLPAQNDREYPGDAVLEKRIRRINRWNAMAMVQRANTKSDGIGGHLSSYASSAHLYEVGFNHFFRGPDAAGGEDLIYYQGHASPGVYARAFLEGRLSEERLDRFRQEAEAPGISSYPHPRLMPEFWQFPTVSMGIGPINAIYSARFARYLQNRKISDTSARRVWAFLGDGECDEPESLGQLSIAAREGLDNLIFVVNCNLQRLDGPVRGNGKIIQELEAIFRGAGWRAIKVIWAPEWDELFEADEDGLLRQRVAEVVDGQWQKYSASSGDYMRQHLFGSDPRLLEMVSHLSDEQIRRLRRGGHSYRKIYAAYEEACRPCGKPTVILCHTVKGWNLGAGFESSNGTHQKKTMELDELRRFRDVLELPFTDAQIDLSPPFYHPGADSPEVKYLLEQRRALGGCTPARRVSSMALELPPDAVYAEFFGGMATGEASTTMVFSRLLAKLIRDKKVGRRIVPIIPDEARTFGLHALFGQVGIYAAHGQLYEPVDKGSLMYYREAKDGQVLEEGITEAGSMASFTAAATSYSSFGEPMIPFYIFYSMFGFQRTGDQMWALGDAMGRGFLLGATAGRTTLNGEGLQHEDGHSLLLAATMPAIVAYDIAFAFELATIMQDGMRRMYVENENITYYITLQNENYRMPPMPEGAQPGILKGIYRYRSAAALEGAKLASDAPHLQLFGSGCIMLHALRAQEILAERYGVAADVWGVTSYQQLRRNAVACDRYNRLHPSAHPKVSNLAEALDGVQGPFIAASDYMTLVQDQIARWIPGRYIALGTDGYGMSDTREALRRHFEVDAECIVIAALDGLRQEGKLKAKLVAQAIKDLGVDPDKRDSALT